MSLRVKELEMLRCPSCGGSLTVGGGGGLSCGDCRRTYPPLGEYHDFFVEEGIRPGLSYPRELEHLLFTKEKILLLKHRNAGEGVAWVPGLSSHIREWNRQLDRLQESVGRSGTSERERVEFLEDDPAAAESREQREFTRRKSEVIMEYILSVRHRGNRVLHVGCGGSTNEAIPLAYESAGFVNYGIDAVRSYVREFHAYGKAHLANALALPFADETFDIVNFTDILEHLFDPLGGLHEAARVLKREGYLLLDTPNRGCPDPANPLSWLRYRLGLARPSLLKPRTITGEWAGEVLFHTEFTRREIELLLSRAGLSVERISPETVSEEEPAALRSTLRKVLTGGQDYRPWFALARKSRKRRHPSRRGTSGSPESSVQGSDAGSP